MLNLFSDTTVDILVMVWGLIFVAVMSASIIEYRDSKKNKDNKNKMGILGGSLIGLLPGCGGTLAVTSMYTKKKASKSAVVASFIATMGEGAFTLIAINVKAYVVVSIVTFVIAILIGLILNNVYKDNEYMGESKQDKKDKKNRKLKAGMGHLDHHRTHSDFLDKTMSSYLFYPIMALSFILTPLALTGFVNDMGLLGGETIGWIGWTEDIINVDLILGISAFKFMAITLGVLLLIYVVVDKIIHRSHDAYSRDEFREQLVHGLRDAAFIVVTMILSTIAIDAIIQFGIGEDNLVNIVKDWGLLLVIAAVLLAALPGCASYIAIIVVVGSIYDTTGVMMWGVLIGGAISTSGDGIFGLMANDRRTVFNITYLSIAIGLVCGFIAHFVGMLF